MTITDDELARLEALAQAATPGPWRVSMTGYSVKSNSDDMPIICAVPGAGMARAKEVNAWQDTAYFIAAARDSVPALVAEVRRWRLKNIGRDPVMTERDALRAENERLHRRILELEMDTHPVDAALDREGMLPIVAASPDGGDTP